MPSEADLQQQVESLSADLAALKQTVQGVQARFLEHDHVDLTRPVRRVQATGVPEFVDDGDIGVDPTDDVLYWVSNGQVFTSGDFARFQLVEDQTLLADAATVTFSSVPSTFRHLRMEILARSSRAGSDSDQIGVRFNGDSAANYDIIGIYGFFTDVTARVTQNIGTTYGDGGVIPAATSNNANMPSAVAVQIPHYTGTTFHKSFQAGGGFADNAVGNSWIQHATSTWRSTAAITSITLGLYVGAGNFKAGSRFTLYALD
jgi:hypothetical protein